MTMKDTGNERKERLIAAVRSTQHVVRNASSSVGTVVRSVVAENVHLRHRGHPNEPTQSVDNEAGSTHTELGNDIYRLSSSTEANNDVDLEPASCQHERVEIVTRNEAVADFASSDAVIFFTIVSATMPLWNFYLAEKSELNSNASPVMISWLIVAFSCGLVLGQLSGRSYRLISVLNGRRKAVHEAQSINVISTEQIANSESNKSVVESQTATKNPFNLFGMTKRHGTNRLREMVASKLPSRPVVPKAWSMLNAKSKSASPAISLPWQRHADPLHDRHNFLTQNLLERFHTRKKRHVESSSSFSSLPEDGSVDPPVGGGAMGSFNLATSSADSLVGFVVDPLFTLRGMDVLLSEDPEHELVTHPWLIEQGLRDVPAFTVNILTQWGNILIYFEVPGDLFVVQERESDADDVKAAKRFVRGDADYRNARLKMIPSLVDGPLPIRMVAPPKKEKVVNGEHLPISWKLYDEEQGRDGRKLCSHLEATLDCMTSRTIRSMASLVKTYLHVLVIDIAVVVATPHGQTETEPSACLGLWRFNHIDVSRCPQLPDRYANESSPEVFRASMAFGLSSKSDQHP